MKKNLFDLNENLDLDFDYVYYNQGLETCIHKLIAKDLRDNRFKCTGCLYVFEIRTEKELLDLKNRIIREFNFEKIETDLKKQIKKRKLGEKHAG